MSKCKSVALLFILICIVAVSIFYMSIDFSRFFGLNHLYERYPSDLIKRINVILSTIIVWIAGKDRYNSKDSRQMKTVFLVICCGEAAFLLRQPAAAIGFFAICQLLLIFRNGKGLKRKLLSANLRQKEKLIQSGFTLMILLAGVIVLFYPIARFSSLFIIASVYGMLISTSLWVGLSNDVLNLFPQRNSKMVALGMLCFYCCDFLVGLDGILEPGIIWLAANSTIWVFYTPAIVLLALSSYKYDARR